jgi:8-oxo-dGTP pyrophosphatase MutT (NUDIX family)
MFIKILNDQNEEIGCISREYIVPMGLRHQIGRVIIYSRNNKSVLLQQRSVNKSTMPGAWDTSSSGHIDAHEETLKGAARELKEEIGVEASSLELQYVGEYSTYEKLDDGILNRQTVIYALLIDDPAEISFTVDPVELETIDWIELSKIDDFGGQVTKGAKQALSMFSDWIYKDKTNK